MMAQFYDQRVNLADRPVRFAQTNNCAFRRDVFEKIGGFDEGIGWFEDVEFCLRFGQQTSYQFRLNQEAIIYHRNRTTLRGVFEKFFRRGSGRAALAKRSALLRDPAVGFLFVKHSVQTLLQLMKLTLRCLLSLFNKNSRKKVCAIAFWMIFHAGTASGLMAGTLDWRNSKIKLPQIQGIGPIG